MQSRSGGMTQSACVTPTPSDASADTPACDMTRRLDAGPGGVVSPGCAGGRTSTRPRDRGQRGQAPAADHPQRYWVGGDLAAEMGISRATAHKWIRRRRTEGDAGPADRSSRPRTTPHRTSATVEAGVCPLRQAVALGERAVLEDEVRIVLAQDFRQAWGAFGEETDDRAGVGVGGGLADAEPGGDLRQDGVLAQVHQCHHRALGRAELAASVTLTGDDEHGDPLHERMGQVECGTHGARTGLHRRRRSGGAADLAAAPAPQGRRRSPT